MATSLVYSAGSCGFSDLIKGHPTVLIENGDIKRKALRDAHMSDDDLDEELRQQGVRDPDKVAEARLERSGKLSVIKGRELQMSER